MKVSELRAYLEEVEEEHGDVPVHATCDGWLPAEIEVEWQTESERLVLSGVRSVGNQHHSDAIEILNDA